MRPIVVMAVLALAVQSSCIFYQNPGALDMGAGVSF